MENVLYYLAHDPIGNCEWQLSEFDTLLLASQEENGITFIAVDADGNRQIVGASEVTEPQENGAPLILVQPVYVDERMEAAADVFDALQALLLPEAAMMRAASADDADVFDALQALLLTDADVASTARDPAEAFKKALDHFRAMARGGDAS